MRLLRAAWAAVLAACLSVPDYQSGVLRCDQGRCPPGMECRGDDRCYRIGAADASADAPVDAPVAPTADAPADAPFDVPVAPTADAPADAPPPDAPFVCSDGDRRCLSQNLETCIGNTWVPASPSCADNGQQCFDPGPAGGGDAYCGTCVKGARRCTTATPPVRQTCPDATGVWEDLDTCTAGFGCFDSDGENGPQAYCGECTTGDKRCTTGLQTCVLGLWGSVQDCTVTPGWTCFDPAPAGGNDAYCGVCLVGQIACRGDNRDQCNPQGSDWITLEACTWGCNTGTVACCAEPDCGGATCGDATNVCGKTKSCGPCSGVCCPGAQLCCVNFSDCCDTICCGGSTICCEPGVCSPGPCQ